MSLFCPPPIPNVPFLCLSLALPPPFTPNLTYPQGVWAPLHLSKSDAFCDFSSWFSSLLSCCAGMHDGIRERNSFLPQFNSLFCGPIPAGVRGFRERGKGWRAKENRNQGTNSFFVLFDFFKIMINKRAGDKAAGLAVALTRMAWISLRMTNSWRGPMIECVWLSLAAPCPVR